MEIKQNLINKTLMKYNPKCKFFEVHSTSVNWTKDEFSEILSFLINCGEVNKFLFVTPSMDFDQQNELMQQSGFNLKNAVFVVKEELVNKTISSVEFLYAGDEDLFIVEKEALQYLFVEIQSQEALTREDMDYEFSYPDIESTGSGEVSENPFF